MLSSMLKETAHLSKYWPRICLQAKPSIPSTRIVYILAEIQPVSQMTDQCFYFVPGESSV